MKFPVCAVEPTWAHIRARTFSPLMLALSLMKSPLWICFLYTACHLVPFSPQITHVPKLRSPDTSDQSQWMYKEVVPELMCLNFKRLNSERGVTEHEVKSLRPGLTELQLWEVNEKKWNRWDKEVWWRKFMSGLVVLCSGWQMMEETVESCAAPHYHTSGRLQRQTAKYPLL